MMKITVALSIVFAFLSWPLASYGANHALVVGGACEILGNFNLGTGTYADHSGPAVGHWNLFRPSFESASQALRRNGWITEIQYDGDNWERPWPGAGPSTPETLIASLEATVSQLHAGDQFLLAIAAHGANSPHEICLGTRMIPIASLRPYLTRLRQKGVRVAVIDDSCYSGHSVDELSETGACVLSSAGPGVTSGGDVLWAYLFGLGLAPSARVPSYYLTEIPHGSADVTEDRRISMAEAYSFALLHSSTPVISRSSDCPLDRPRLRALIEGGERLLRASTRTDEVLNAFVGNSWHPYNRPSEGSICSLEVLPDELDLILHGLSAARTLRMSREFRALGAPASLRLPPLISDLRTAVSELRQLAARVRADQDEVDRLMDLEQRVPSELIDRVAASDREAALIKARIFAALRPLLVMACDAGPKSNEQRACRSFDLFPARRS